MNGTPTHRGCLMAAAAVVDQALNAAVFDERAIPRIADALDALVLAGIQGDALRALKRRFAGASSREALERTLAEILIEVEDRIGPAQALELVRADAARAIAFLYNKDGAPRDVVSLPVALLN